MAEQTSETNWDSLCWSRRNNQNFVEPEKHLETKKESQNRASGNTAVVFKHFFIDCME